MNPKYKIGDVIECSAVIGWVKDIYVSTTDPTKFIYAIEEPESEAILYYDEQEVSY